MFWQKNLNKFRFLQLTFAIFVKYRMRVRQSQIGNVISVCLCAHLFAIFVKTNQSMGQNFGFVKVAAADSSCGDSRLYI